MCQYKTSCVQIVGHGGQRFSKRGQEALWSGLWALWRNIWTVFDAIRFWFELHFKPSIANKAKWLWNLINFFVPSFCYRFSALTVHNHNSFWTLFEQQTNRNVALNYSAIYSVIEKTKDCAGSWYVQRKHKLYLLCYRLWTLPSFTTSPSTTVTMNRSSTLPSLVYIFYSGKMHLWFGMQIYFQVDVCHVRPFPSLLFFHGRSRDKTTF